MSYEIIVADVMAGLARLPDESVQCVVTSPPYWGLRDYGVDGQIGLEETPEEHVEKMVEIFREVRRVLRSDGTCWLNYGDTYNSNPCTSVGKTGFQPETSDRDGVKFQAGKRPKGTGKTKCPPGSGLKPKDLVGMPWRVALALQADGWWLRSDIIWHKKNPMPESVTDRPTKAHEYVFLLSKSARYFYDQHAIRETDCGRSSGNGSSGRQGGSRGLPMSGGVGTEKEWAPGGGRNKRTVWTIATQPFPEAHFATFPEDLVRPCIQAGTSAVGCCPSCHSPWERSVEKHFIETGPVRNKINEQSGDSGWEGVARGGLIVKTRGWKPTCACEAGDPIPCSVLDPFSGSGTTGLVALKHGRTYIGIELNPEYADLSREYLDAVVTGVSVKEKRSGQQALFNQSTIFEKASTA